MKLGGRLTKWMFLLFSLILTSNNLEAQNDCDQIAPIDFIVTSGSGSTGDIVCVNIMFDNLDFYEEMLFLMYYDPQVLEFVSGTRLSADHPFNVIFDPTNEGRVITATSGLTSAAVPSLTPMLEYCFRIIGDPCQSSPLLIDRLNLFIQIDGEACEYVQGEANEFEVNIQNGMIDSDCGGLCIYSEHCDSPAGENLGSLNFNACGGVPGYMFDITGPGVAQTNVPLAEGESFSLMNLLSGIYTITLTDMMGTVTVHNVTIGVGSPVNAALAVKHPNCNGRENGEITVINQMGGAPGDYHYQWSNNVFEINPIMQLDTGYYAVTVSDSDGCAVVLDTTLRYDTVRVDIQIDNHPICDGVKNGCITVTANGGTPMIGGTYDYTIVNCGSNQSSTEVSTTFCGLGPGWVYVIARDSFNCESQDYNLNGSPDSVLLVPATVPTMEFMLTNPITCNGDCDASLDIWMGGSTASGFLFNVRDMLGNPIMGVVQAGVFKPEDLCAGEYMVEITERIPDPNNPGMNMNGCVVDGMITIDEPPILTWSVSSSPESCLGNDGEIDIVANGGVPSYTCQWADDPTMSCSRTNLVGGNYFATLTDDNGCMLDTNIIIAPGGTLMIDIIIDQEVSCSDPTSGIIHVEANINPANAMYSWIEMSDPSTIISTNPQVENLLPGTYIVTVEDIPNNCSGLDTIVLIDPGTIGVDIIYDEPNCIGEPSGSISLMPTGGSGSYTYLWDTPNMEMTQVLAGIPDGMYSVVITDANNPTCLLDTLITLEGPPPVLVSTSNATEPSCFGDNNGSFLLSISGGQNAPATYGYSILDANTNQIVLSGTGASPIFIEDMAAGEYIIFGADDLSCQSDPLAFNLDQPDSITIDVAASIFTNPLCNGDCNGSATIQGQGGGGFYTSYYWPQTMTNGSTISGLCADSIIYVEITDNFGCVGLDSFMLNTNEALAVSISPFLTNDLSCASDDSGSIGVDVTGGNPGVEYEWNPNVSDGNLASNLSAGTYEITVSDENGCTDSTAYILIQPEPIVAQIDQPDDPLCFGGTTCLTVQSASGGDGGPYTFAVQNGINIPVDSCVTVNAGEYLVSVFDQAGCAFDTTIVISQPDQIIVDLGQDIIEIDLGDSTEVLTVQYDLDPSQMLDTIIWSSNGAFDCLTNDCDQILISPTNTSVYEVIVTDQNGCTGTDLVTVQIDENRNVFIPTAFSPDAEQSSDNQTFKVFAGQGVSEISFLRIFDRWGNMVFEELADTNGDLTSVDGWDGTYNGDMVDPGIFVVYCEAVFVDGVTLRFKRSMTMFR